MEKNCQKYLSLAERKGKLPYTLQNDYLFKAALESDERILRSLLCSLLFLEAKEIVSIQIINPIIPGDAIDEKTTILDINLVLNDKRIINLEMQRLEQRDWPERSLIYLCRIFNNVKAGEPYGSVIPAHHIGILGFGVPGQSDEFYSHFYMMNEKTHEIYSDKFRLSVLNLNCKEFAGEKEKRYGLDKWACAFLASEWEDFQMLAAQDSNFELVADSVYQILSDEVKREACRRYETRKAEEERMRRELEEKDATIQRQCADLADKDAALADKDAALADKDAALADKDAALADKDAALADKDAYIASLEQRLAEMMKG